MINRRELRQARNVVRHRNNMLLYNLILKRLERFAFKRKHLTIQG